MTSSFSEWLETYAQLYGEHATESLFRSHRELARDPALGSDADSAAAAYRERTRREARHALGEYFTPAWLADHVLDRLGAEQGSMLLDPAAGLGVFLECAARRGLNAVGYELNPATAASARARGLQVEVRNTLRDPGSRRFRFIMGNPPWVNWRHLNRPYKESIAALWREYGLVPTGGAARLGAGMDDLSILFTYLCADRLLEENGRMALVLSRTLFQSVGGGRAFRRFELPAGRFLRVVSVEEVDTPAFEGATTNAVVAVFENSAERTVFPVPYFRGGQQFDARPVADDPASSWSIGPRGGANGLDLLRGESAYAARVGAHSGGASGVFWVDVVERRDGLITVHNRAHAGRVEWPQVTAVIEPDLVRTLVRGRDVRPWSADPSCSIVLPHTSDGRPVPLETMRDRWPRTFAYFETFREQMLKRPHYRQHFESRRWPYWSLYNVGAYTFARYRVVWREQSHTLQCAVLDNPDCIADAKLVVVACESCDEARYLAAVLNSQPAKQFVEAYAVRIQISTHVLRNLRVPKFDPADDVHRALAAAEQQSEVDALAGRLWRIPVGA